MVQQSIPRESMVTVWVRPMINIQNRQTPCFTYLKQLVTAGDPGASNRQIDTNFFKNNFGH